ncbi:MAG: hypothetical protein ACLPJY_12940 [Rhodomicrobium sp.]
MESPLSYTHTEQESAGQFAYKKVIAGISNLNWSILSREGLINVAWAYYYFSTQFRENLEIALSLYPDDERLLELDAGERNTDNLSPWPGVAAPGEKMHHEEFMRRTLALEEIPEARRHALEALGQSYLANVRSLDKMSKAISLPSYEDGGLEAVFRAILTAQNWDGPLLGAFRHFLAGHVALDSDPDMGHGALCRHLKIDDRVLPLWIAFRNIFVESAPELVDSRA